MAEGNGATPPPDHGRPERGGGARAADWITIWQSELAAMATDPELHETWLRQVDLWAGAARSLAGGVNAAGAGAGTAAAAGAPAAMAAPDARDAIIDRLAQRVAELERQLGRPSHGSPEFPAG